MSRLFICAPLILAPVAAYAQGTSTIEQQTHASRQAAPLLVDVTG